MVFPQTKLLKLLYVLSPCKHTKNLLGYKTVEMVCLNALFCEFTFISPIHIFCEIFHVEPRIIKLLSLGQGLPFYMPGGEYANFWQKV